MSREAFGKWYAEAMGEPNVQRYADGDGVYANQAMQSAWLGWQAALSQQEIGPVSPCKWDADTFGVMPNLWLTDCGHWVEIREHSQKRHEMRFCCFCGNRSELVEEAMAIAPLFDVREELIAKILGKK